MSLPLKDIFPATRDLAISTFTMPRALNEAMKISWRSAREPWIPIARASIKAVVGEVFSQPEAANLAAAGAGLYAVVDDLALVFEQAEVLEGDSRQPEPERHSRARFDEYVAMPHNMIEENVDNALVDLGLYAPNLFETVDGIAGHYVDSKGERRRMLAGAALMRNYHLAAISGIQNG